MVTRRYIKKGGKTFGPYYYKSYRDNNGHVKKKYLENYSPQKSKCNETLYASLVIFLVLFFSFVFLNLNEKSASETLTGRAVFTGLKAQYSPGEQIQGDMLLNIKKGEFIPKNAKVSVSLGDTTKEFTFSDVTDYETTEGYYYAKDSSLFGFGQGYGLSGKNTIYPEINFKLEIITLEPTEKTVEEITPPEEDDKTGGGDDEERTEAGEEKTQESAQTPEGQDSGTSSTSDEESNTVNTVTSFAISEVKVKQTKIINGKASYKNNFIYKLEANQKARLVPGSVKIDKESFSDSTISLETKDNTAIASTKYSYEEEGFGKDYFNDETALAFRINLRDLDLKATADQLKIKMFYNGLEIASHEESVNIRETNLLTQKNESDLNEPRLLKEIPTIRIPFFETATIDLGEYFEGADSYEIKIESITPKFKGNILELIPDEGFKGARKTKITAVAGQNSIDSNEFIVLVSSGTVQIKTSRERIRVGETVKWTKEVSKENPGESISIEIPQEAENLNIKRLEGEKVVEEKYLSPPVSESQSILTGGVVIEVKLKEDKPEGAITKQIKSFVTDVRTTLKEQFGVAESTTEVKQKQTNIVDLTLDDPTTEKYIIKYETPAPEKTEQDEGNRKLITITGPSKIEYKDVIAFTELSAPIPLDKAKKIKLYWLNSEGQEDSKLKRVTDVPARETIEDVSATKSDSDRSLTLSPITGNAVASSEQNSQDVPFDYYDLNSDGLIDYIEWVVPSLGSQQPVQTYEVIIEVIKAEHLDANKEFVSNIYSSVSALDGIWSETIPTNHYVRVTFERNLTQNNDITIYPRIILGLPKIEVYKANTEDKIAEFTEINSNQYNKVYLSSLEGAEDMFDLKIVNGALEFDYIIDPDNDGPPRIEFGSGTPADGSVQSNNYFSVGLNTEDADSTYAFVNFDSSLIGWWRLDNDATAGEDNTHIADWSENGNEGFVLDNESNNAAPTTEGKFGGAFAFDGVSDCISIWDLNAIENKDDLTISAWAKPSEPDFDTARYIVSRASFLHLRKESNGKFTFGLHNGISETNVESSNAFSDTNWHHIIGVFNKTSIAVYVDGHYENGVDFTGPTNSLNNDFLISAVSSTQGWKGSLDEVMLFNRALSSEEIKTLYDASANQYSNDFTDLADGNYDFQGFAIDSSGNKNQTETRTVTINFGCGDLTSANTVYQLTSDVYSPSTCFNILANNITLDCQGKTINYSYSGVSSGYGAYNAVSGVRVFDHNLTTIKNCVFVEGAPTANSMAINLYSSSKNRVESNTITAPVGISLTLSNENVIFANAMVVGGGISFYQSSYNNIINNQITASGLSSGISLLTKSNYNVLSGNIISTSEVYGNGISIYKSEFNNISNGMITTSGFGGNGISLQGSNSNRFFNMNIITADSFPVSVSVDYTNNNFSLTDSILSSTTQEFGAGLSTSGEWNFTNVTKPNGNSISVSLSSTATGTLNTHWYLNVHVSEQDGSSVSNATVIVRDKNNGLEVNETTDVLGSIPTQVLLESSQTSAGTTYFVPHLITTAKADYLTNLTFTNISATKNTLAEIVLDKADMIPPTISFTTGTENEDAVSDSSKISVAVSVANADDEDAIVFSLYDSKLGLVNSSTLTNGAREIEFTGLTPDTYQYNAVINDTNGNSAATPWRTITLLPSCLNLSACKEESSCIISQNCALYSSLCSNNLCDFTTMVVDATVYTLYDPSNGRNLALHITSNKTRSELTFLKSARIEFSGKNGTEFGQGSVGGDAGIVNITVPDLFNTTNARFVGVGGNTTRVSASGGDGGILQLNFRGLIGNFTNPDSSLHDTPAPDLSGGDSVSGIPGVDGHIIYNQNLNLCPRDADVTGDGIIINEDINKIWINYNAALGDGTNKFRTPYDINCDKRLNVVEMTRIGFEYEAR